MTSEEAFHEIYSIKKRSLIGLLAFYVLFGTFLLSHADLPTYAKIGCFVSFGIAIFTDGLLSLREYRRFWKLSHEFFRTLEDREKAMQHIKKIVEGADSEKLADSILLTNQGLLEHVRESGGSGAWKRFEVNGEFDAVLLLKRKSLPLDEILEMLDKAKQL
jgi:hypothetical protein